MTVRVGEVKEFWNTSPCQSLLSKQEDRKKYFEEITEKRFKRREWHVPIIARFSEFAGKDVLEVGCGIGTDGFEFARHGARYTGVDLTPNSVQLARERFALFNIDGTFQIANAEERLPFPDNSFDHIYSFGVIHHSPNTDAIVKEMYRVLRPGGSITVMVYNRSSINYYIEIMLLRRLFRLLLYPQFMPRLIFRLTGFAEWKLVGHRELLMQRPTLSKEEWVSKNTDGPNCPLSKVYNKHETAELFRMFRDMRQEVWEFNTEHWSFIGSLIPDGVARRIGRLWGWHRMIYGTK